MTEIRPLYVWGNPTAEQIQIIRLAKEELGVDFFVQFSRATPGLEAAVLAFEPVPFLVHDGVANLTSPFTVTRMAKALSEVLHIEDPVHLQTAAQQLSEWFGSEVRE